MAEVKLQWAEDDRKVWERIATVNMFRSEGEERVIG
jgi:hypothetical protein